MAITCIRITTRINARITTVTVIPTDRSEAQGAEEPAVAFNLSTSMWRPIAVNPRDSCNQPCRYLVE